MPVFDYRCPKCGRVYVDVYVSHPSETLLCRDRSLANDCDGVLKKLPATPNIIFKGNGFYETDYKEKK